MKNIYLLILFLLTLSLSCSQQTGYLEQALLFAGENRNELEKVLDHYKSNPADSLKYKSAVFLIENMMGHYSVDPAWDKELRPVYDKHVEISEKHNWSVDKDWGAEIDSLKDASRHLFQNIMPWNVIFDVESIKADWLINHIELSFKAWENNIYTRNMGFNHFCEYILPYRIFNGVILDDSRKMFYDRHASSFLNKEYASVTAAVDSVLVQYSDWLFNSYYGASIPIYSVQALEQIKRSTCVERSWYNSMLLSSLGITAGIDFVPARGNRNNPHIWNVVIAENGSVPFDSYWSAERWSSYAHYDNESIDPYWGKYRLAKIYRHTYSTNRELEALASSVKREEIPALFLNSKIKDVSSAYFNTADVTVELPKVSADFPDYVYICVYGNRSWVPVQWGKVDKSKNRVCFEGMGRDIVYMVCKYKNGLLETLTDPFYLDYEGQTHPINESGKTGDLYTRAIGFFVEKEEKLSVYSPLNDAKFVAVGEDATLSDTLHTISIQSDIWNNIIELNNKNKYRYIDLYLPSDTVSFCDISFYTNENDSLIRIGDTKLVTPLSPNHPNEHPAMILDNISATGFQGRISGKQPLHKIRFDLGNEYEIAAIHYTPYSKSKMRTESNYKLFYWSNGWKEHDAHAGNNGVLIYESVPMGTLYRIETEEVRAQKNMERIFLYKDGHIYWM